MAGSRRERAARKRREAQKYQECLAGELWSEREARLRGETIKAAEALATGDITPQEYADLTGEEAIWA